jgi:hypothetical protein
MADAPVVHIGENSPEYVALKLAEVVARIEGKSLYIDAQQREKTADRKWLLDTYAECLNAVKGYRSWEE